MPFARMRGKLDNLLTSDVPFFEFMSKDGHHRFIARHQVASVEPTGYVGDPVLVDEPDGKNPYEVLELRIGDTFEHAMAAFQKKAALYNPDRWTGEDVPPEFSRYALAKSRQINIAFTTLRAEHQSRAEEEKVTKAKGPLFGAARAAG